MPRSDRAFASLLSITASWGEQQIRAHPSLHAAFFALISRHPLLRAAAGRMKFRVRSAASDVRVLRPAFLDDDEVTARREAALKTRLGLRKRA